MKIPSLSYLFQATGTAIRRFPFTMLSTLIAVLTLYLMIWYTQPSEDKTVIKIWMLAQLGIPLMTGLTVATETLNWQRIRRWLLPLGGILLLAGYFFCIDLNDKGEASRQLIQYVSLMLIAHLLVSVAPYLGRRTISDFWEYNKQLFANFAMGVVYTGIIYLSLAFALLAVDQLFELKIRGKQYAYLLVTVVGFFQTIYFLFHFPDRYEFQEDDGAYTVVFKNLCKFIFIPVVGLYFLILYAYSGKILAQWSLPHGWVGSLVLGFSTAGIFTYLINYMLPKYDDSVLVSGFRRWFWWILSPLMVLLFLAIGYRISDYGVTEERYLVADIGVWLAISCLYFLFSKTDNIKFIPVSLALFALVYAFGPFNASDVSQRSQTKELERLFTIYNRLENGKIKSDSLSIPAGDQTRIYYILDYLNMHGGLTTIRGWLPTDLDSLAAVSKSNDLLVAVKDRVLPKSQEGRFDEKFTYEYKQPESSFTHEEFDVTGYRKLYQFTLHSPGASHPASGVFFKLSDDRDKLEQWEWIKGKQMMQNSWPLKPVFDKLGYGGPDVKTITVPDEKCAVDLSSGFKFVLKGATVSKKQDVFGVLRLSGALLVK